jgi:hypothetical protein
MLLEWSGDWKVTRVVLPKDIFDETNSGLNKQPALTGEVPEKGVVLAEVEYDGKKQSILRYGELVVTVDGEVVAGGSEKAPFATGTYKGQKSFSIHLDQRQVPSERTLDEA